MRLPVISADKANHIIYGGAAALFGMHTAAGLAHVQQWHLPLPAPLLGLALAALVGALKEVADWLANCRARAAGRPPPHSVDGMDFAATLAGGFFVMLAALR
jgi:hypothetical protein